MDRCEDGFEGSRFVKGSGDETSAAISPEESSVKVRFPSVEASKDLAGNATRRMEQVNENEKLNIDDQAMLFGELRDLLIRALRKGIDDDLVC